MAVKRTIPHRLEKAEVAGETESFSNSQLANTIETRLYIGTSAPAGAVLGSIWRNPATNPDEWKMLTSKDPDVWTNMLVTETQHGLMRNTDRVKLSNSTSNAAPSTLMQRDSNGDVSARIFHSTSSIEYKKGVTPIENATALIQVLEGVHFTWKENDQQDIGLIAEQVEPILPEIVQKGADGKITGIAYSNLVAVLIQGFKEQQSEIEKIKNHLGLNDE